MFSRFACVLAELLGAGAASGWQEVVETINKQQGTWLAAVPSKFESIEDVAAYLGAFLPGDLGYRRPPLKHVQALANVELPESFDSRSHWSNCSVIADIADQSACGASWAFASTDSFQSRACVATSKDVKYSVEDTTFCSNAGFGCQGGGSAWTWFKDVGVVTGGDSEDVGKGDSCLPYNLTADFPSYVCKLECSEAAYPIPYAQDKLRASDAYSVEGVKEIQTELMQRGPLYASFTVYSDFPAYQRGVYRHTSGTQLGGLAVELIGWGTESGADYWLIKNSWNDDWGDHGLFKIARGTNECGIESGVSAGMFSKEFPVV